MEEASLLDNNDVRPLTFHFRVLSDLQLEQVNLEDPHSQDESQQPNVSLASPLTPRPHLSFSSFDSFINLITTQGCS